MNKYILYNKDKGIISRCIPVKCIKTCVDKVESHDRYIFNFMTIGDKFPIDVWVFDTIEEAVSYSYDCYCMHEVNTEILVVNVIIYDTYLFIGWIQNKNELEKAIMFNSIENNIKNNKRLYLSKNNELITKRSRKAKKE